MDARERDWAKAMAAGRRGDTAPYEKFLGDVACLLRPAIRSNLRRHGFGDAEAEDVVQEALMAIHAKRHTWDEKRPLTPWLKAIARHKLLDAARRLAREAKRRHDIADEDWANLFEAPAFDPDRGTVDVERHVEALPARQRDVIGALVHEGVSVKTAAARLGTSEGVVRMTFHRALAAVRRAVGSEADDSAAAGARTKSETGMEDPT